MTVVRTVWPDQRDVARMNAHITMLAALALQDQFVVQAGWRRISQIQIRLKSTDSLLVIPPEKLMAIRFLSVDL